MHFDFVWDGLDAFGREVAGATYARVGVGHVYPYERFAPAFIRAVTQVRRRVIELLDVRDGQGFGGPLPIQNVEDPPPTAGAKMTDNGVTRLRCSVSRVMAGTVVGIIIIVGSGWRERMEGRAVDPESGARFVWGFASGLIAALVLCSTSGLRRHGRWGSFANWTLTGVIFFAALAPLGYMSGMSSRLIVTQGLLLGIGGGLSMGIVELQLRD